MPHKQSSTRPQKKARHCPMNQLHDWRAESPHQCEAKLSHLLLSERCSIGCLSLLLCFLGLSGFLQPLAKMGFATFPAIRHTPHSQGEHPWHVFPMPHAPKPPKPTWIGLPSSMNPAPGTLNKSQTPAQISYPSQTLSQQPFIPKGCQARRDLRAEQQISRVLCCKMPAGCLVRV